MMKVAVAEGIQCVHDGTVYGPGETAEVPKAVPQFWLRSGWADEVEEDEPPPKKASRNACTKAGGYEVGTVDALIRPRRWSVDRQHRAKRWVKT